MANELEIVTASEVSVIIANAALNDTLMSSETNDNPLTDTNTANYPFIDFALECELALSPGNNNALVYLYYQLHDITGSGEDTPTPTASTWERYPVGVFHIRDNADINRYHLPWQLPMPLNGTRELHFQIRNETEEQILTGWELRATPWTYVPGS